MEQVKQILLWLALSFACFLPASSLTPSEALSEYLEAMASFDAVMVMSDEASFAALMHETGPNDPSWVLDAALIALADPEALPVEAAEEGGGTLVNLNKQLASEAQSAELNAGKGEANASSNRNSSCSERWKCGKSFRIAKKRSLVIGIT